MSSPYRIQNEVSRAERPRAELVYVPGDAGRHAAPARGAAQLAIAGAIAAVVTAGTGYEALGAAIALGAAALGLRKWRRAPEVSGLSLRVDDGVLVVTSRASKEVRARTRLADLRDVRLDTKSIRKVEPGRDVVPAVQFIQSQVGPEIDVARIVLETTAVAKRATPPCDSRPSTICLTEAFLAHSDSVEWVGKIRVFLRSHGWLPEDERPGSTDADDDADDDDADDAPASGDGRA